MGRLAYDSKAPNVDESDFVQGDDWKYFYGNVEEERLPRIPEPHGNPVNTIVFVDADHSGNVVTRSLHTSIIIFVWNAPIVWFSKRQNTFEAATFGIEFVALRICK